MIPFLAYFFVQTLHLTLRVRHAKLRNIQENSHHVVAFWHECILQALHAWWRKPTVSITSRSRDGDLMKQVLDLYGVETIRGSSTRGADAVLRQAMRAARNGRNVSFTPDGPKGPRRVVKAGVVYIAQVTGLPVVPFYFTAKKKKRLRSWDQQIFPIPFSKAIYVYGAPIVVPRDGEVEEWRLIIERAMNDLADEAERDFDALWAGGAHLR